MKCDLCDAESTVYLTQLVNGQMKKVNLCQACAKEKGVTDPTGFALADMLFSMGKNQEAAVNAADQESESSEACPTCGFAIRDFEKTGRMGCSECYDYFSESLPGMLSAMHKGLSHKGKVPKRYFDEAVTAKQREKLEEDLEEAVRQEDFETAAALRDQLQELQATSSVSAE
ncbi:MAG: UvrB/UvrC motif-containing protein [Verrucomicrobiota bacterium]